MAAIWLFDTPAQAANAADLLAGPRIREILPISSPVDAKVLASSHIARRRLLRCHGRIHIDVVRAASDDRRCTDHDHD